MGDKFRPDTDDSLKATLIMYFQGFSDEIQVFSCVSSVPNTEV